VKEQEKSPNGHGSDQDKIDQVGQEIDEKRPQRITDKNQYPI
jgi:hypothetical protein